MRNIGEIISSNRKKMKLSQPMLAELLQEEGINLSAKAISKWETNATEPSIATFMTVCKVLNITNIYEAYFGENPSDPLSTLNDVGKEKALDYIELLHDSGKYEKQLCKIIPFCRIIDVYENAVSAGIGIFSLNGEAYIKKLHDDKNGVFLISLNEKYPPIPVGENDRFDVLGKVVGKNHPSEIKEYLQ